MPPISSKLNWPRTKQCEQCRRILEPWQDGIERHCVDTILTSVDTSSPFFGPDLDGRGGSDGDFDEEDIYMYNDEATVCLHTGSHVMFKHSKSVRSSFHHL